MREGRAWPGRMGVIEMYPVCSVRGCGRRVYTGGETCVDCSNMDAEYDRWQAKKRSKSTLAGQLTDAAFILAFFATFVASLYYLWPYLWAVFELWFGGAQ